MGIQFDPSLQKGSGLCYFEYIMIKYETNYFTIIDRIRSVKAELTNTHGIIR